MIGIGDEVVCIFPGKGSGLDCKVGNIFIVRNITPTSSSARIYNNYDGNILVFDIHPYQDKIYGVRTIGVQPWRYAKVKDIESFTKVHTSIKIKGKV